MMGSTGRRLFAMLQKGLRTDVTIYVGNEKMEAHSLVVASLEGHLGALAKADKNPIKIQDNISPQTFEAVLE